MSKGVGYLLPPGEAYTNEYECCLVVIPAKDEYRRAFFGALDYLSTWIAWERDTEKRGVDAALSWLEANEITREFWEMGFCGDMLAVLISIDAKLGNLSCCDGSTTVGDVVTVVTVIDPGEGPDPTVWGETSVADWDEWLEYVCYHAHKFVDQLVSTAGTLDLIAETGAWTVEFFANILRVLRFLTLVYPVSYAAALEIYESFQNAGDMSDTFDDVAADFEAARNDIVCAFINGTSVSDAVEDALGNPTLWSLLYQFNNYDSLQALVYEGTVDETVYLAPVKRDDCECEVSGEYYGSFDFTDDTVGPFNTSNGNFEFWSPNARWTTTAANNQQGPAASGNSGFNSYFSWGATSAYYLRGVRFKYRWDNTYGGDDPPIPDTYSVGLRLTRDSDSLATTVWEEEFQDNGDPYNWKEVTLTGDDLGGWWDSNKLKWSGECLKIVFWNKGPTQGSGWKVEIDDFEIWCDDTPGG